MRTIISLISFCAAMACFGQDTVQRITAIDVVDFRIERQQQLFSAELQKVNPAMSYALLLQMQSGIFIKSQGLGTLSTPSYKGLGSTHLPITLNGYSLQSSMNATTDLSLISTFHFNNAKFSEVGFDKAMSTNLGPSLELQSNKQTRNELLINANTLGQKSLAYGYAKYLKNGFISASAIVQHSPNRINLSIYNKVGDLENTAYKNGSFLINYNRRISLKLNYKTNFYFQYSDRQLPSSLNSFNDGRQKDLNLMFSNKFVYSINTKLTAVLDNQLWQEQIHYSSLLREQETLSKVFNSNTLLKFHIKNKHFSKTEFGLFHSANQYQSEALQSELIRNTIRLNGLIEKRYNKSTVEFTPSSIIALNKHYWAGSIKWRRSLNTHQSLSIEGQKVLRLPSLNELYWYEPGFALGNESLKPESGYRLDIYYLIAHNDYFISLNPFFAFFNNLITWTGYPIIQATNIQKVMSRGAVLNANYSFKLGKGKLKIHHNQHWVWSTYADKESKISPYGKQLIYTPILNTNVTFTYLRGKTGVYINQQYTSKNFYSSDNNSFIKAYTLVGLGAYRDFRILRLSFSVNNILNTPYFSIPNQPLPGIHGDINLSFNLSKSKK